MILQNLLRSIPEHSPCRSYHTSNLNPIFEADIKDFNRKFGLHSHGMPKAQLPAPHRSPSVSPGPASSSSTAQPACPEAPPRALAYQSTTSTRGTSTPPSIVSAIQAVCGPDTAPRGRSQERNPGGSAFNSSVRRRSPSEEQVPASSNRRSSKQRAQSCSPARVFSQTGTAPEATHRGHQMSPGSARSETQTDRGRLGGQRARSVPRGLPQNDERYLRGASQPRPPLPSPFTTDQDTRPGLAHGWTVLNPPRAAVANTAAGQKRGPSTSPSRGSRSPERRGLYGQQRF